MPTKTKTGTDVQVAEDSTSEVAKRLVVELTTRAAQDMAWLVDEEEANKTTLVNRAVQVYKMVVEAQRRGRRVMIGNPDGTDAQVIYVV
jgi:hypothetical protein